MEYREYRVRGAIQILPVIRARQRVANRNMLNKRVSIGIAGAGRVAQVLGRLLSESGQPVVAIAGRNPERTAGAARFIGIHTTPTTFEKLPALASRILIAVSDTAVEPVA